MNFNNRRFTTFLMMICIINIYSSSYAQTDHSIGNWNFLYLKAKISPRWALMGEGHIRSTQYNLKYDYFEVKTGISYNFTRNLAGLIGTGFYNTDKPGELFQTPALQKEFRTWLELSFKQKFNRFNFDHRVRLEQRFIPDNYKNRLKYRLALTLPINKAELIPGCIYLSLNDELWMPQYGIVVEKNRLYAGLGCKFSANAALQLGCVNDNNYSSNGYLVKNYLQIMLIYDFTKLFEKHS
jgi:hypothetical protein